MRKHKTKNVRTSFAVCVDNRDYPASLELHKIYRVLPDASAEADGDLRVVDESGEDYLFSKDRFVAIPVPDAVRRSLARPRRDRFTVIARPSSTD